MITVDPDHERLRTLSPSLAPRHEWQSFRSLADLLGMPLERLEAMQQRYATGTQTEYAIDRGRGGEDSLVRIRPSYHWVSNQSILRAFGVPKDGRGFARSWGQASGLRRVDRYLVARRLQASKNGLAERWAYALVDPDYRPAPRTTPAKGPFLRIWEKGGGFRGQVVVFNDHYDNSVWWGWWGPGLADRDEVLAQARRVKQRLESGCALVGYPDAPTLSRPLAVAS
jgi:hypothetical protein